tara:strand:+ start:1083 stop:1952 length:870 start_codon:yes stop_codon:yes gene_type:complete
MAKFNLDNYETVEERLKQYWIDNPSGKIETNVVHITDDGTCVTIKAEVFVNTDEQYKCISTGIAQETKGQGGFANTDAWVENCETSAIGRALANWNYQGSKAPRPSRQEMSKVGNKPADVKVEKPKMTSDKEDIQVLEKAKQEFAESITEKPSTTKADQMNMLIDGFGLDKTVAQNYKRDAFKKSGLSKDVESWTNDDMSKFLDLFEKEVESTKSDTDLVEDVFGEVKDLTKNCPECGKSENIEDNRQKKQDDPDKYGKIPSWSCSKYQGNNGCGWTAWGDTDCPTEWL